MSYRERILSTLLTISIAAVVITQTNADYDCKSYRADVAFVLDVSSSMSPSEFRLEKSFVSRVVSSYTIGPAGVQAAAVTFSDDARAPFLLRTYKDTRRLIMGIERIRQRGGNTNIGEGIRVARNYIFTKGRGARPRMPKIIVLVTDGHSQGHYRESRYQSHLAKKEGITIFVIGVGNQVKRRELLWIATDEEHLYSAEDFSQLFTLEQEIRRLTCRLTTHADDYESGNEIGEVQISPGGDNKDNKIRPDGTLALGDQGDSRKCSLSRADVLFIMDESNSIWPKHFATQLRFISEVAVSFEYGPKAVQVALISFSSQATAQFDFNTYDDKGSMVKAIENVPQKVGNTSTWEALKLARLHTFKKEQGARDEDNVKKIAIVITDGNSQEPDWTADEAELLRKTGVSIYAVGIGEQISKKELGHIASRDENVISVEHYSQLLPVATQLKELVCGSPKEPISFIPVPALDAVNEKNCPMKKGADIFLLMDVKSDMTRDRQYVKEFTRDMMTEFYMRHNNIRVSVISRNCRNMPSFGLNKYDSEEDADKAVNANHADDMSSLLRRARNRALYDDKVRKEAKHIVVLVTDHIPRHKGRAIQQSLLLRRDDTIIYTVGVGDGTDSKLLNLLVTPPSSKHMMDIPDFRSLGKIKRKLVETICEDGSK